FPIAHIECQTPLIVGIQVSALGRSRTLQPRSPALIQRSVRGCTTRWLSIGLRSAPDLSCLERWIPTPRDCYRIGSAFSLSCFCVMLQATHPERGKLHRLWVVGVVDPAQ